MIEVLKINFIKSPFFGHSWKLPLAQMCWNEGSNTTCCVLWSRYEESLKGIISVDLDVYIRQELLCMMKIIRILCSGISRGFAKGEVWFRGIWNTSTCKHVEVLMDDFWEGGVLDGSRGVLLHASSTPDFKSGGGEACSTPPISVEHVSKTTTTYTRLSWRAASAD